MNEFKKTRLSNGIRVFSERHGDSRAISLGIWVLAGTRHESSELAGISHLTEHLVFKGTKKRSSFEISKSLEALGGELNAYTTREYTCYHAYVLKDHFEKALDVLADLVSHMKVSPKDFQLEKGVVLQEIAMAEDSSEEIIYDHFFHHVYGAHALGRPILGSIGSIARMTQRQVQNFYNSIYTGNRLIVSAAGDVNHDVFVRWVAKKLGTKALGDSMKSSRKPPWHKKRECIERVGDQVHVLMGWPAASFKDLHRFEASFVNTLLGGGMTSRLYQSVREKKGLVYSIHSSLHTQKDCGMMLVYAQAEPKNVRSVVQLIAREFQRMKSRPISKKEVDMMKTQICGSILLGADDIENRMSSLAINEMVFGEHRSVENVMMEIQEIQSSSVNQFIQNSFDSEKVTGVLLGPGVSQFKNWFEELEF